MNIEALIYLHFVVRNFLQNQLSCVLISLRVTPGICEWSTNNKTRFKIQLSDWSS